MVIFHQGLQQFFFFICIFDIRNFQYRAHWKFLKHSYSKCINNCITFDLEAFRNTQSLTIHKLAQTRVICFSPCSVIGRRGVPTYADFHPTWNKMWCDGQRHLSDASLHGAPMKKWRLILHTLLEYVDSSLSSQNDWKAHALRWMTVLLCCCSYWICPMRLALSFDACFIESASSSGFRD